MDNKKVIQMEDKNRPTGLSHEDYTEKQLQHIYQKTCNQI